MTPRQLIDRGFYLFPLVKDSKQPPKGCAWKELSTNKLSAIQKWVEQGYGLGIDCGKSKIGVVDIDMKHGNGCDDWKKWIEENPGTPGTLVFKTPTNGLHIVYADPEGKIGNPTKVEGTQIDGRGVGGYIVAPGTSLKDIGTYVVHCDRPIAPAPEWIIGKLQRKERAAVLVDVELDTEGSIQAAIDFLVNRAPIAKEGLGGDDTTTKYTAMPVKDLGISEDMCFQLMAEHYNPRCQPPWDLDHLRVKVANAYRYGQNAPGSATATAAFADVVRDMQDYSTIEPPPTPEVQPLFRIRTMDECVQAGINAPPIPKIMDSLIYDREGTIIFSSMGVGKTILGMQVANMIANGESMCEQLPNQAEPSEVLYFDFELSDEQVGMRYRGHKFGERVFRVDFNPDADIPIADAGMLFVKLIEQTIIATGIKRAVIDNITYMGSDLTEVKESIMLMKALKEVRKKLKCMMVIIAHTPKIDEFKALEKKHLAGSANLGNFIDAMIAIGNVKDCEDLRYIKQLKCRNEPERYRENHVVLCKLDKVSGMLQFVFLGFRKEEDLLKGRENPEHEGSADSRRTDFIDLNTEAVMEAGEVVTLKEFSRRIAQRAASHRSTAQLFSSFQAVERFLKSNMGDLSTMYIKTSEKTELEIFKDSQRLKHAVPGCRAEFGVTLNREEG